MFIESITPVGKYKYRIKAENSVEFYAYTSDLKGYSFKESEDFPDALYENFIKERLIPRARKKALDLLTRSDLSEASLRQKLKNKLILEDLVEDAVEYVKRFNYINDERYVENYLYKNPNKSIRQIKLELRVKGISNEIIDNISEDDEREKSALKFLIKKKVRTIENLDEVKLRKLYAYLYRKGFSPDLISSTFRKLL